ncbi:MAG TPA: uracil-DNA glycosylase [Thermoanaerobaculia bacterium]|nr:uracil-DNA glycosylase [Thermoanaerobaculia bacterium]
MNADLAAVLEYLQGIGWEEVYAPAPQPAARGVARAAATPGVTTASSRAAGSPLASAVAPAAPAAPSAPPAERAARLAQVGTEASACTRCRLAEGRRTVVFGTGNPDADLMFIGEGPGAEEDRQGLPFVGPAGQLLTRIIGAIGLARGDVYIANVVKCRPPGNRDPQPDEVAACRGFLEEQVRLVAPRVLVALGRIAAQTLLGNELPVGRMRGSWHRVFGVPLRVTYHPAALLRNDALKRPTWDDMQVVRDVLSGGG